MRPVPLPPPAALLRLAQHPPRLAALRREQGAGSLQGGAQLPAAAGGVAAGRVEEVVVGVPARAVEGVGGLGGAQGQPVVMAVVLAEEGVHGVEQRDEAREEVGCRGGCEGVCEPGLEGWWKVRGGRGVAEGEERAAVGPCGCVGEGEGGWVGRGVGDGEEVEVVVWEGWLFG